MVQSEIEAPRQSFLFRSDPFCSCIDWLLWTEQNRDCFLSEKILWSCAWHPRSALRPAERCRFCRMLASSQLASAAFAGAQSIFACGLHGLHGGSGRAATQIGELPLHNWIHTAFCMGLSMLYPCLECRLWLVAVAPVSSLGSLGSCIEVHRPLPSWIQNTLTRVTVSTPNGKKKSYGSSHARSLQPSIPPPISEPSVRLPLFFSLVSLACFSGFPSFPLI